MNEPTLSLTYVGSRRIEAMTFSPGGARNATARRGPRPRPGYKGTETWRGLMAKPDRVTDLDSLGPLLQATAQGDRQAFARVYQLSSARLFAVALRITRRRETAEDALQDAYVTIWRKAGQYYPDRGAPMAWMTTIVRSRAIDHLRKRAETDREPAVEPVADGYDEVLVNAGTLEIRGCLDALPENQRKAILLAYYYGLTHPELAVELAAPLGTVKSWVRRGLLQLKECVDQ